MGYSLNRLASMINNSINGGYGVINENFTLEQIKDEIVLTSRTEMKKLELAGKISKDELYQRIDCVEVECKPLTECGCIGLSREAKGLYVEIPLVTDIRYIGTIEYNQEFNIYYGSNISYMGTNRFTKNKPTAWVRNKRSITILNPPTYDLEFISIEAIFSDPRETSIFNCSGSCVDDDDIFPAPDYLIEIVKDRIIQKYLGVYKAMNPNQPNTQQDSK